LLEQFERELQLVEDRQAVDRIGDRRLMLHDIVHVPHSLPGSVWPQQTLHLTDLELPDLGDQGCDV
jgi:hypothetical protein